jgi:predicted aconitase
MMYSVQLFETLNGVPKPYLREWIMAVIATGTVVRWVVVGAPPNDRVKHESDTVVTVYLTDDDSDAAVALIAKYTHDEIDKFAVGPPPHNPSQTLIKAKELLDAARQGLLEATGITRAMVTPPSVP